MAGLAYRVVHQLAAAAVALALSGVPQLIEPPEQSGHRCHCPVRNGHHDCDCPLCHAEAARLGKAAADDPSVPPCHRALVAQTRAAADESAKRRSESGHCLTSTCSTSEGRLRMTPSVERFTMPSEWRLSVRETSSEVMVPRDLVASVLREPETPPPRGA